MNSIGNILELLTKYGIIDIFFGLGIIAYIREKFRKKSVKSLDGIEVSGHFNITEEDGGILEITIKNVSRDPLYLYRSYFLQGYNVNKIDKTTIGTFFHSLLFLSRINDKIPRFYDRRNNQGEYILRANTTKESDADSVFLRPGEDVEYYLGFQLSQIDKTRSAEYWDDVLERNQCGLIRTAFVHGANSGLLETQI